MHKYLRSLVLGLGVASATLLPAFAQVNSVPVPGTVINFLPKQTYSASFFGLVPPASATDVVCIAGNANKTIRLLQVRLQGTAGTLVTLPVNLVRRVSLDTGGTAGTTTANPANTISSRDTNNGASTAVLVSYTAVPTIVDTSPTYLDSGILTLPTTAAGTVTNPMILDYGRDLHALMQAPTIRSATGQLCLNLNAVSVSSGVLNGSITWSEE